MPEAYIASNVGHLLLALGDHLGALQDSREALALEITRLGLFYAQHDVIEWLQLGADLFFVLVILGGDPRHPPRVRRTDAPRPPGSGRRRAWRQSAPFWISIHRVIKNPGIRPPPMPREASTRRDRSMSTSPPGREPRSAPSKSTATYSAPGKAQSS